MRFPSHLRHENLARCFGCETNFNPIDMVIAVKKTGFRQTADFLTDLLESGVSSKPAAAPACVPSGLASLSSVLSTMAGPLPEGIAEPRIQSLEKEVGTSYQLPVRVRRVHCSLVTGRAHAMARLAYTTGLRPSEIARIRMTDISFEKGELTVPERKGNNPVRFPLPEETVKAVAAYVIGARPEKAGRNLFVSLAPPHNPVSGGLNVIKLRLFGTRSANMEWSLAERNFCANVLTL